MADRVTRWVGGVVATLAVVLLACAGPARAGDEARDGGRTFYVDSADGQDAADGRSPQHAWRSLDRVNAADLRPGDTVRFRRGGLWRGSLVPVSGSAGSPVTYTAYGDGAKPRLLGSVPRDRAEDWVEVRPNVWATLPMRYHAAGPAVDLGGGRAWRHHQEGGAHVAVTELADPGGPVVRVACTRGGSASNHVQLWGPAVPVERGQFLRLTFRARCTQAFAFPGVGIVLGSAPYTGFARSGPAEHPVGPEWAEHRVVLSAAASGADGRLHVSLGGAIPAGAVFEFQPLRLEPVRPNVPDPLAVDVGNIIFDGGAVCGWKRWSADALTKPYDFYYDGVAQRVYLYSAGAPPSRHRGIELALARHVVSQGGRHDVVYDGLAILYGAAHGFGGGGTHHLVIRNCDVGYVGGAHQFTRPDGKPVRYGNGIEFWNAAHDNLVEGCRIWEIYDAALTNQGKGPDSRQVDITYRDNVVWNAEYSFEYWNGPESAVTRGIRFVNNTCVGAGAGWAHAQRPDPNGSHLMFYTNTADTAGVEVRYNVFAGWTDWGSRYTGGWRVLPDMTQNVWFSRTGIAAWYFKQKLSTFDEYRQATGLDAGSRFVDPRFVDPSKADYRLAPDSPARALRPDGGVVGAEGLWR